MTGTLERVLVRPPLAEDAARWREHGWRAAPDPAAAAAEHEVFCGLLEAAGAEVVALAARPREPGRDLPVRPRAGRRRGRRPAAAGQGSAAGRAGGASRPTLESAGVPVAATLEEPALAEGGDTLWLDERTLLVGHRLPHERGGGRGARGGVSGGRGGRVRPAALERRRRGHAPALVHLAARPRSRARVPAARAGAAAAAARRARDRASSRCPDEEFESQGPNVLALGPRRALALDGNPETRRRMERAGVDVVVYRGEEISRKGDGGPTCLTRPLLRLSSRRRA